LDLGILELKRAKRDWSWEDIKSKVVDYSKAAVDVVKTTGTKIKDATVDAYENRGEIYANAKESVSNFGSKVSNKTKEIYENRGEIYENTKEGLSNFGQKVANTTKDVYEKITD
jgi:hypothetical protein